MSVRTPDAARGSPILLWLYDVEAVASSRAFGTERPALLVHSHECLARHARDACVVVIEIGPGGVASPMEVLRALRRLRSPAAFVGWQPASRHVADLRATARLDFDMLLWSTAEVLFPQVDDVADCVTNRVRWQVLRDLACLSQGAWDCVRDVWRGAALHAGVLHAAGAGECTRRTLERRCALAALPGPGTLIRWLRLLAAAKLLEECAEPLEEVARRSGFASALALRRFISRHLATAPGKLREEGISRALTVAFVQDCLAGESSTACRSLAGD